MWTYRQATGEILHDDTLVGSGYSGFGEGKNNPAMEAVHNVGPIPQGWYTIGEPVDTKTHGPYVLRLTPASENQMYDRAGFLIHGDSLAHQGAASQGCIVTIPAMRIQIWKSGDHQLTVVPGLPPVPPLETPLVT